MQSKKYERIFGLLLLVLTVMPTIVAQSVTPLKKEPSVSDNNHVRWMAPTSSAAEIIAFAKKFIGIRYRYGATNPTQGFDCSGYVYYVFKKFNIDLPRSSSAIGQAGEDIALNEAQAGDIILFTGTNPSKRTIGHVGIVLSNDSNNGLHFIHASSGKAQAVTETPLAGSYKRRFMKVIRVL